ncbi:GEVED domain-containing protein [Tenacibaculum ovolyticum]|uniref:GEVED domain-containing protein n=1 Tax=Tenacibaculum ovolyticum TaxID=104270 RepID=UPI003BA88D34
MKNKYLKSLVLASVILGSNFQTQAQDKREVTQIRSNYNLTKLQQIKGNFERVTKTEKEQAVKIAKKKGWKTKFTTKEGSLVELQRVVNGKPIYYTTFNVAASKSTRTNHLNSGGSLGLNLMGQGMTAHVWDGGLARTTHQEYDGAGGNNRFSIGDGTTVKHYHSAHVTGIIMSSGVEVNAKGMAPHGKAVGYDWNNDKAEATTAAANGMLISNHSYGYATRNQQGQVQLPQHYFGGYIDQSRAWDEILFNAPNFLMVVAAGNDGNDNTANTNPTGGSGFDKLTGHSVSKNNLVVANAQDANVDANGNLISVSIAGSSSEGPTDDFRIKPDITGSGTGVYSTYESSDTAYSSITGTSMASPNVAGSLILLQQHYKNLNNGSFMKAATLKGLALHTADDAGVSGPDAVFGWGLLHAKRAAEAITNNGNQSKIEELTLISGQTYTITVDSDGTSPLLASISWTDRPGVSVTTVNSTKPVLVNDLDIRVSKSGTAFLPYELTGATTNTKRDNNVDPFERVDVANASGTYTITVTHKGSLTGGSQNYSLIVTGLTGAPVVCNATVPTGVSATGVTSSGALVNWSKVSGASYDVRYKVVSDSSWTTSAVSTTTKALSGLSASTQYEVQVRSKCLSGSSSYGASVNFTTPAVIVSYCTSKGASVNDEYIQKVVLGTINNASTGGDGYSDYTSISTDLIKGGSNTITITPKWTGAVYSEGYGVWIDYNQDGDFTDAGETILRKSKSKTTPVSETFTVPSSALSGVTRMRVALKYNATPKPCETLFSYGEVEDYTVNIQSAGVDTTAPSAPGNVSATSVTQTTLTLNWSASIDNVAVTEYDIYQGVTKIESTANTTMNVTGLIAATGYVFTIKAKDGAGNISLSSNVVNVTTLSNAVSYCESRGSRVTYEWIDYVAFGGMINITGANDGYEDFTSKVAIVVLGSTNQLVLSAGFLGTAYNEHFTVWIDYNQDGDFTDAGEQVTTGNSSSGANRITDIVIPSDATIGRTRMRVSMKYNAAPTSCESFEDGEVEDYAVIVAAAAVNAMPTVVPGENIDSQENLDLIVYPNPSVDFIRVKLASQSAKRTYKIINVIGSIVQSGHLDLSSIDVSNLNKGMYILEVGGDVKVLKTKFLKK